MSYRYCPRCGLKNISERRTCKRCSAQLSLPAAGHPGVMTHVATIQKSDRLLDLTPLLPIRRFVIRSPLSLVQVRARLRDIFREEIVETSGSAWFQQHRTYRGWVVDSTMQLNGPFGHRQWTMVTDGTLEQAEGGSILRLSSQLSLGYILLFILVIGGWVVLVLTKTWGSWFALVPLVGGMFFYTVFILSAKSEATDTATMLARMLNMPLEGQSSEHNSHSE